MTKTRKSNPQPTPGTETTIYLAPRSKEPRMDSLYLQLIESGWRFDTVGTQWFTPIDEPEQRARLCWTPDFTEAWLQPPNVRVGDHSLLPSPIARFRLRGGRWEDAT